MKNTWMGSAAPNLVNICVDWNDSGGSGGRIYHNYAKEAIEYQNVVQLLSYLEKFYDRLSFPQAAVQMRNFVEKKTEGQRQPIEKKTVQDFVVQQRGKCATFLVFVQYRQNATWQGTIMWVEEGKKQEFRSALELLMLIDNALE
ncbi:MAG: hypothetical protein KH828_05860 [Clostridiales bacterium]|nr:hypothetical protein [Clostridiales bacterium]